MRKASIRSGGDCAQLVHSSIDVRPRSELPTRAGSYFDHVVDRMQT